MERRMALIGARACAGCRHPPTRVRAVGECVSASSGLDLYLRRISPESSW